VAPRGGDRCDFATHPRHELLEPKKAEPWSDHVRLGQLLQASTRHYVCAKGNMVVMVKQSKVQDGTHQWSLIYDIRDENIVGLRESFEHDNLMYLTFDYYRFTLLELLCVPFPMREPQVRVIACSVRLPHPQRSRC